LVTHGAQSFAGKALAFKDLLYLKTHMPSHWNSSQSSQVILTNIYGPCTLDGKLDFLRWFKNISMPDDQPRLIVGDFNLIRRPENRSRPTGDNNLMMAFNEAISKLGVIEIPLSGQEFTWSNKQQQPLLERLDWFFINQAWSL
jgi:hypothetical protein